LQAYALKNIKPALPFMSEKLRYYFGMISPEKQKFCQITISYLQGRIFSAEPASILVKIMLPDQTNP